MRVLVKLSPAQRLVYHHLLVKQDPKMAKAIRAEAQKHKEGGSAAGVGAAAGVGGGDGGGGVQGSSPVSPVAGGDVKGDNQDEMAAAAAAACEEKRREDGHYQKLTDLLLQLRWVF